MALTKITPQMFDTSATAHDLNVDNGTFVVDGSASRVGIGTATPSTLLDVNGALTATTIAGTLTTAAQTNITSLGTLTGLTSSGTVASNIFLSANNNTGNTNKVATFLSRQYDSGTETEGFLMLQSFANSSGNRIDIGGGSSAYNAATEITFNTAANTTTRTGTQRLVVTSAGLVGIGTTSPTAALSIIAGTNKEPLTIRATTDGYGYLTYENGAGNDVGYIGLATALVPGGTTTDFAVRAQSGALAFATGGNNERMRITSAGLVGIGRTPAFASLEVEGDKTLANSLQLQLNGATNTNKQMIIGFDTNTDESHIISQIAGSALKPLIISASRVGIGASSMTATKPFHVKTNFNATGAVGATFENTDTNGSSWLQLAGNGTAGSFQIGASGGQFRLYNDTTNTHILDISNTGALLAGAGSASLPSLSFKGDPNTGIYNGAADNLYFSLGGVLKGFWSATQFNVTGNGVFSGTGSFGGSVGVGTSSPSEELHVTSAVSGQHTRVHITKTSTAGTAGVSMRSNSASNTWTIYQEDASASDLYFYDGAANVLTLDSTNNVAVAPSFLAARTFTRWNGSAPNYSLTISADNSGNAIEVFRTSNSKMLQYMSADGKYYFDMYGSSTPEIRFRNAGTDWMRTQGTRLFVGGSAPVTLGAGGSAAGGAANQTILQVQGAVDMGYQGRYTHGLWGPATVASSGAYTHLRTAMWGGGSPHGNSEYIMGGFLITGYRYSTTANHRALHQFHNWSGSMHNYTVSQLIDGGGWNTASHVYVDSTGYVTIRLESQSSAYRMFYVEYIQYSQYGKVATEITAVTVSNSATI